jgi:hypothetical protein
MNISLSQWFICHAGVRKLLIRTERSQFRGFCFRFCPGVLSIRKKEAIKMNLPVCCGHEMLVIEKSTKFVEALCDNCKEVVYVKNSTLNARRVLSTIGGFYG